MQLYFILSATLNDQKMVAALADELADRLTSKHFKHCN